MSKEENVGRREMSYSSDNDVDPDAHLPVTESFLYDFLRKIANNDERLMYIYVFTAIVLATVIITLFRSFLFFAVSRIKSLEYTSNMLLIHFDSLFFSIFRRFSLR